MEEVYLTDKLLIRGECMYHQENNTEILIRNHNWHKYLYEFGWTKLHKWWIKKLNSFLEKPKNNSLFGCLDCGGGGDCLFHCLSFANGSACHQELRKELSHMITEEKYNEIISIYRILDESGDFEEEWDPQTTTYEGFKQQIITGGNEYWGDSILLDLLREQLDINIFILYSNELEDKFYNYPLMHEYDRNKESVILLYENEDHFKLIGHFREEIMVYKFTDTNLPNEIKGLMRLR